MFGASHDEFMDTPIHDAEWLLRIDDAYLLAEAKASNGNVTEPAGPPTPRIS